MKSFTCINMMKVKKFLKQENVFLALKIDKNLYKYMLLYSHTYAKNYTPHRTENQK